MTNTLMKLLILGAPGSGKGSISSRIIKHFNVIHLSSGDKLRLHIKNKTALGTEAQKYTNSGKLVPDELMVKFILNEIKEVNNQSWLLDGFPRTVTQAEALWKCEPVNLVINLCVPFHIIIDRIKNRWVHLPSGRVYNIDFNAPKVLGKDDVTGEQLIQREDDQESVVQKRLEEYDNQTRPVVEFYKKLGILKDFEGETTNGIWPHVLDCLNSHMPTTSAKYRASL